MLLLSPAAAIKAGNNFYTYIYDVFGDERESPDAYTPQLRIIGTDLGIGDFSRERRSMASNRQINLCIIFLLFICSPP